MTTPTLEHLTKTLAAANADLQDARDRAEAIKEAIRQHPDIQRGGPDRYQAGDATLVVTTNRRFDSKTATPLIPDEVLPLVSHTETVIDREKVKALLPDVYEAAQTHSAYRVAVQ